MYIRLSVNNIIKKALDEHLDPVKKWNDICTLLFEYCNAFKKVPTISTDYKGHKIGKWLKYQKPRIKDITSDIYIKLSRNQVIQTNLDEYLKQKELTKDIVNLSWNESRDLLFEYCDQFKKTPQLKTKYKDHKIGKWLHRQKQKISNFDSEIYKKLSSNSSVKKCCDEYLKKKDDIKCKKE